MRFFSKLFLVMSILSLGQIQASSYVYSGVHALCKISHHVTSLAGSGVGLMNWIKEEKAVLKYADAPEIIVQFCREKFKVQGLDPEQIKVKITERETFAEVFGTNYLLFGPLNAHEFKNALENPTDEISIKIIGIYGLFIDHEIAHLKNNDVPTKRMGVLIGSSLVSYLLKEFLMNSSRLSSLFQKPTNIKELGIVLGAYSVVNIVSGLCIKYLNGLYAQHQERRADAYAVAQSKDSVELRYAADFIEKNDEGYVNFLCSDAYILNPNIPVATQFSMNCFKKHIISRYQLEAPQEDFRTWVKKQTKFLALLKFTLDPEHPTGISRAQLFRAAADKLESSLN